MLLTVSARAVGITVTGRMVVFWFLIWVVSSLSAVVAKTIMKLVGRRRAKQR